METNKQTKTNGFTLIEILLVIALIAILAGIVILAINPARQLADGRNTQRRSDLKTIVDAVYQYYLGNGSYPTTLVTSNTCAGSATQEICKTGAANCSGLTDLTLLTSNQKYLVSIPQDPSATTTYGSGYFIAKNSNNRIMACAPQAENGETISITR